MHPAFAHLRPPIEVTLDGATLHVRPPTYAALCNIDREVDALPESERGSRYSLLVCSAALCTADGTPLGVSAEEVADELSPAWINALVDAILPKREAAKND